MIKHERSFDFARKINKIEVSKDNVQYVLAKSPNGYAIKAYEKAKLPVYSTKLAAGADFFCAEDVVIPSIWKQIIKSIKLKVFENFSSKIEMNESIDIKPTPVHTGIKADMMEDEALLLFNRSSNPKKLGLVLANSVGVVDADYFESEENDGEIIFAFYNFKPWDVKIKVGDKVGQGVFQKYLRPTKNCIVADVDRTGGFGSTGK